jgi:S1-C subfamily serine protease
VTEQDLAEDTTSYQYYASYWAKLPTPLLGVHIIKLKQKANPRAGTDAQEENGLKVIAVVQDSPAAKAAIVRGDALLKIGDVSLLKPEDLFAAVKRYAGQTVPVLLKRGDEEVNTSVALNTRK